MNSPLILIAASARAIASMAHRAGFSPWSVDLFADEDLQRLGPVQQISRLSSELAPLVAAGPTAEWIYGGALENDPALIDQLAVSRRLLGNAGAVVRRLRDPLTLQHTLQQAGFQFPLTVVNSSDDKRRWLRKPLRSGGGQGIRFASETDSLEAVDGCVWQQFIAGVSGSALYVAAAGQCRLLMTTEQLLGDGWNAAEPFLYVGSVTPLPSAATLEHELVALGEFLAAEFRMQGVFGVDFVAADGRVWPVEVNPRLTASAELLLRISDLNPVALHVAACRDGLLPTSDVRKSLAPRSAGKAIVYAPRAARAGHCLAEHIRRSNERTTLPTIADIPPTGTTFGIGEPIVTVFAEADRRDELLPALRARAAAVIAALDD